VRLLADEGVDGGQRRSPEDRDPGAAVAQFAWQAHWPAVASAIEASGRCRGSATGRLAASQPRRRGLPFRRIVGVSAAQDARRGDDAGIRGPSFPSRIPEGQSPRDQGVVLGGRGSGGTIPGRYGASMQKHVHRGSEPPATTLLSSAIPEPPICRSTRTRAANLLQPLRSAQLPRAPAARRSPRRCSRSPRRRSAPSSPPRPPPP